MAGPGGGTQYEIGRAGEACAATGEPLAPGDVVVTALVDPAEGGEGFDRLDFKVDAWDGGARPKRLFAHWRRVVPEPGAKKGPVLDQASLMGLFEQLEGAEDRKRLALRHVIALILMRKKQLVLVDTVRASDREGEGVVMRLRRRGADRDNEVLIEVVDPGLDDESLGAVTEQLGQLIQEES